MSNVIYCISGLGADEKVFSNLQIKGYELKHIAWLRPHKKETIAGYAKRMAESFQHDDPIVIGVSFGGMMGIEIARHISLKKLILVSSVKSSTELPVWMKLAGKMQLNKLLPRNSFKWAGKLESRRLGVSSEEERKMVRAYRKTADPVYVNWAINEIINWKNNWLPENIIHIHGDSDKIFPLKIIRPTHVIKGGTHMMVFNRAGEIGNIIRELIG